MSALTQKEIGRVRRAFRPLVQRYLSQAVLGRALGISQQSASGVLSGVQFPGLRFALWVARLSGVTLEALLSTPSAEFARSSPVAA